jgi:hypothetical protein
VNKRFRRERGSTKWLWLVLVMIGCVLMIPAIGRRDDGAIAQTAGTAIGAGPIHAALTANQLKARNEYWMSKQGFAHGVPSGAFANALAQVNEEASSGTLRRLTARDLAASNSWEFLGPQPINLLTFFATGVSFGQPHTGAGSFTALAVDANTGNIFAGSANGGLYLSTDGGLTFSQAFNGQPTESVGAIAIDTTTSPSTIYVGTGNPNGSFDAYYGAGVFRSTDGGSTWTQIMPASFANGAVAVSKIALDPANHLIFVGATWGSSANRADASIIESDPTQAGLWRSTDDGASFTQYPVSQLGSCYIGNPTAPCPVDDVEIDPNLNSSNSHNVFVAVDAEGPLAALSGGVFKSSNEGGSFSVLINSRSRSSIAIGQPTGSNGTAGVAYFMIADVDGAAFLNFFYSPDGNVLQKKSVPSFTSGGLTFDGTKTANQTSSFYNQALIVMPGTSNTLFFGGIGIYKSTSNGTNWSSIVNTSQGGAAAFQHAFAYDAATGQMLLADDGGLYSFDPTQNSAVTYTSLNTTIDTTLVQGIGPHPTNDSLLIAGFQGAGTQQYQGSGTSWFFPISEAGDGGFAMYDPTDPNFAYHTYSNGDLGTNVSFAFSKNANSTTTGATWTSTTPSKNLTAALVKNGDSGAAFYPAISVDPTVSHRVFFGAHGLYVSNDGGTTWVAQDTNDDLTGGCSDGGCAVEDIEPVSHTSGWALAMATNFLDTTFVLSNTTNLNLDASNSPAGGTWSAQPTQNLAPLVPLFSTQATGIAVDPNHPQTAYLSLSGFTGGTTGTGVGHIFKTADFGNTWVEADGNLPDVPVLRVLVDRSDPSGNTLYVATDIGVFISSDGGGTWGSFNLGTLQAVPVFDIEQNQNNTIFIGTHGKGVFKLSTATPTITPTPTPTPTSTATPIPPVTGTLTVSPASITFPSTAFGASGGTSPPKTITVTNPKKGKTPPSITITNVAIAGDSNGTYKFTSNGCEGQTLAPAAKCTMIVTFTPLAAAKSTGSVTVNSNSSTKPSLPVKLAGTGVLGTLTPAPKSLKFPKTTIESPSAPLTVTVTNKTAAPIGIPANGVQLAGKFPGDYAISSDTCSNSTVAQSGGTCSVAVTFTPTAKGSRAATLVIIGTTKAQLNIALSGTGQ